MTSNQPPRGPFDERSRMPGAPGGGGRPAPQQPAPGAQQWRPGPGPGAPRPGAPRPDAQRLGAPVPRQAPPLGPQQQYPGRPAPGPQQQYGNQPLPRASAPPRKRASAGLLLGILIPVTAIAAGVAGYFIGAANGSTLAADQVSGEVARVLRDDFGLVEVADVACPGEIQNVQGQSFQCTFDYAGQAQSVTVTIASLDGQLVVGAPQ